MNCSQAEDVIMGATVDALLTAGYALTVFDGEEETVQRSRDRQAILGAMRTTDDDFLLVEGFSTGHKRPWIRFVYGNGGWDVLADHSMSLEKILEPVNALADSLV